jgi:hypothetical protein
VGDYALPPFGPSLASRLGASPVCRYRKERTPDAQPSSKLSLDTPIGNSSAHGGRKEKLTLGDWLREDNRTAQYRARQLALQLIEQQAHDLKAASQLSSETRPQEEGRSVPITASGPMPISGEINYGPVTQPSSTDEVERVPSPTKQRSNRRSTMSDEFAIYAFAFLTEFERHIPDIDLKTALYLVEVGQKPMGFQKPMVMRWKMRVQAYSGGRGVEAAA